MNFQRGESREELELNLIPLIDVLLVILIFLLVSTTYSKYAQLQINLPEVSAEVQTSEEKNKTLNVAVDSSGRYLINDARINFTSVASFSEALKQAAGGVKDPIIAINADAAATHQSVVNVMEAAQMAGFTSVTFVTQKKPAG
ncbi:MAG: biopolymer transporter ExbD [Burkholderiales bacterium]|nr:biopolymer transporter ExbD [Burkholderiales bacterium]